MKKILVKCSSVVLLASLPVLVMAQAIINDSYLSNAVDLVQRYLNIAAALIIALAFIYFLWGIMKLVTAGADSKARDAALGTIWWGLVVLAVMVSVWGLVKILTGFFGVDPSSQSIPTPPVITLPQ